ncbi:MAG: Ig-like domain-containing protein [Algoriphagus aquaeductus]|uniref:Ig-like domain-containing protein n=1 Tax=Algoriphagus aquaeductus TaxID=475299 RepID=UPI00387A22AC
MKQLYKSFWICLALLWAALTPVLGQCILFPGNLVFSGVNLDDDGVDGTQKNDRFSFVLLQDVSENFEIYFTDIGWTSAGSFQSSAQALSDGAIKWTAPVGGVEAGTQITIDAKYNLSASHGTVSGVRATPNNSALYLDLGISGDQLFAFTGSLASPTFIAGVNLNQAWTSLLPDKLTSSESAIPSGLSIANVQNLSLTSSFQNGFTNAVITGTSFSGLFSTIVSSFNSPANWSFDETYLPTSIPAGFQLPKNLSFTVTPFNFLNAPTGTNTITYGNNTQFGVTKVDIRNIATYQWQISTNGGVAFNPITEGGIYSGVSTNTLVITKPPVSYTNYQYRVYAVDACGNETFSSAITLTVNPKTLTASLIGTIQKERDGNTNATIQISNLELNGVVGTDLVALVNPGTGTYASALPGTNIQVTVSGLSITGADVANYILNPSTASAAIGIIVDTTPPDGYTVAIDQDLINESNQSAVSFSFADAEIGSTYQYSFTSSGGGTPVSGSGTVSSASQQVAGINLSGLGQGTITLTLTLTDSYSNTGSPVTDTSIKFINSPPTVANPIPNQDTDEDEAFNFQFELNTFQDPDDQVLSYTAQLSGGGPLPAWLMFDPAERTFSGTPANSDVGTVSIAVTADDENGGTVTDTFDLTVINTNDAPTVVNPIFDQFATQNAAFNFQFALDVFADIDLGDVLTYTAQISGGGELPTWLSFDGVNRRFSGTPGQSDVGNLDIDVIASDGNGGTVTDTFRITVVDVNDAPTVQNSIPNQDATEDEEFVFQFGSDVFFDLDGDDLSYSAQLSGGGSLPGWLTFNPAIRTFSGTPTNSDVGTVSITVTADDGNGGTVTDTFDITVINVNDAPTVANPIADQFATEDIAFNFQFGLNVFNDIDVGDILTYTAQLSDGGSLPLWLSFDGNNRRFSGTPGNSDVGNLDIVVTASDELGASVSDTFTLIVVGVNDAPVVTAPFFIQVTEDVLTPLTGISIEDVDAGTGEITLTLSVTSGALSATAGSGVTVGGTSSSLILSGSLSDLNDFISAGQVGFTTALNQTDQVGMELEVNDNGNTGTGGAKTDNTTVNLLVLSVNDPPVNVVPGPQNVDQGGVLIFSIANGNAISTSDVETGDDGLITVTLTAINGTLTLGGNTGVTTSPGDGIEDPTITLSGTVSNVNSAMNGLAFRPTAGYNGSASLTITSNDGGKFGLGGVLTDTDEISITVNSINPIVNRVTSSVADGFYKIGDVLIIEVEFDQVVEVNATGGSPTLKLETGGTNREAVYLEGSGTNTLSFTYTVQEGDFSSDLDYTGIDALALNGGIIENVSNDPAVLDLPVAGTSNSLSGQKDIGIDGVVPVITSVSVPSNGIYAIGQNLDFTINFSEAVVANGTPQLSLTVGASSSQAIYIAGSGSSSLVFRYTVQSGDLDLNGIVVGTLSLNAGTIRDAVGNNANLTLNSVGSTSQVLVDGERPSVITFTVSENQLAIGQTATVSITFSEAVTGLTAADFTVANGTLSGLSTADGGITWTATLTPVNGVEDATNILQLDNTGYSDLAGNSGSGISASDNYAVDTQRPVVVSFMVSDTQLATGETSLVTLTFSEAVTGLTVADFTVANGTLSGLTTSDGGITWTVTLTPDNGVEDATNVITLDNTGYTDLAGNSGTGTTDSNNYTVDTQVPTAILSVNDTQLILGETTTVTVTFSEAVTGLTVADFTVANGTLSGLSTADGGITWTATLTPDNGVEDPTNVITLDNTGYQDAAGNAGTGTTDSNNYAVDTQRPTATITVGDTQLTVGETTIVTIAFSEAVTGLSLGDFIVSNGLLGSLSTEDNMTYTAILTPLPNTEDATNVIRLDNTGFRDLAGNSGSGTTESNNYLVDTQPPLVNTQNITIQLNETGNVSIQANQVDDNSTDGFGIADLMIDQTDFACSDVGPNTVILTVTDVNGNTATGTAIVTVEDNIAPVVNTQNITIQLDATGNASITADQLNNGSADACGIQRITASKTSFDCSNVGPNTVTLTVTDVNGNTATGTAIVTVEDNTAPVVNTRSLTIQLDATGNASITADQLNNGSADACGIQRITASKTSFDCSDVGPNTVTLTVTDVNGNTATGMAIVTVEDSTAPVVNTRSLTIQLDATGNASITADQLNNGSADACGIQSITASKTSFDCSNVGPNTVTLTVTDVNGNTATGTAVVTVEDRLAPVPTRAQLNPITAICQLTELVAPTAEDNCGGLITATTDAKLPIRETTTVTWVFVDSQGNQTIQTQEIRIEDPVAPEISEVPEDFEVILFANRPYVLPDFTKIANAKDNCTLVSFTQNLEPGRVFMTPGKIEVVLTAVDSFENETTVSFTITLSNRLLIGLTDPALITVPWNTAANAISVPQNITVTLSDGEVITLPVTWDLAGYNPLLSAVYQFMGTLTLGDIQNPENLQPKLTILVADKLLPTDILLSNSAFGANTGTNLPIGGFTTVDPQDNIHVYELVSPGLNDGKYFRIVGDQLFFDTEESLPGKVNFTITVRSTDRVGNSIERTFTLTRTRIPIEQIEVFNSFTPNNDGTNDTWGIPDLQFFQGGRVQVFDRDGRRVFYTESPAVRWDGSFEGKELPTGSYIWILESRETGEVRRGTLTLIRN